MCAPHAALATTYSLLRARAGAGARACLPCSCGDEFDRIFSTAPTHTSASSVWDSRARCGRVGGWFCTGCSLVLEQIRELFRANPVRLKSMQVIICTLALRGSVVCSSVAGLSRSTDIPPHVLVTRFTQTPLSFARPAGAPTLAFWRDRPERDRPHQPCPLHGTKREARVPIFFTRHGFFSWWRRHEKMENGYKLHI